MRKPLLAVTFAASVALSLPSAHAIPPIAGGVLASDNIDLVATIPDTLAIGAKIVGDHMYVTTLHGLTIYDISQGLPVVTGTLQMPHWENESVDTDGETLLISADFFLLGGTGTNILVVVDVSNVNAPVIRGVTFQDDGHTATCIKSCDFAWTSGNEVFDLRDPSEPIPASVGYVHGGYTHNWNVDATGLAWGDGVVVLDTNGPNGATAPVDLALTGYFGWHNSIRPNASNVNLSDSVIDRGELVIGAGEDIWNFFGPALNCEGDDHVYTSWFRRDEGAYRVENLDSWNVGKNGTLPSAKPTAATFCSSHWLDFSNDIVTVGWYEQGTRILDVSNPRDIRQIGYFMPVETQTWAAYMHQVDDSPFGAGTYVYTMDLIRGIDVFKLDATAGASPTVLAPYLNPTVPAFAPSEEWGWACRVPAGSGIAG